MRYLLYYLILDRARRARGHKAQLRRVLEAYEAALRADIEHLHRMRRIRALEASLPRVEEHRPWYKLYRARDDAAFLSFVSLPPPAFHELLTAFARRYDIKSGVGLPGRPTSVPKHAALGLVLAMYTHALNMPRLCEHFGVKMSTLSRVFAKAEAALALALADLPNAAMVWPTQPALQRFAAATVVRGVVGLVDVCTLAVQAPTVADRRRCEGTAEAAWLECDAVWGMMIVGLDGTLLWYKHNLPGFWDIDFEVYQEVERQAAQKLPAHHILVAPATFPVTSESDGHIVTPLASDDDGSGGDKQAITSLLGAAEWGTPHVKLVYQKLGQPLPFDRELRRCRISNILRLYNFRLRSMGTSPLQAALAGRV
ncbi:hypothetical protein SPRG_00316 [Saprolegnia parasitica CBS 223.65]|uniref:DDE Tnp4 domain-containing protein n=1 Tax=Saprolegnia parasitica (strain CBS 223.65) TaxID=695850 RepID=A0A067CXM9_SAPPC|nr:hypothetical protein SPRG_00316 [Saprolegnia parasitica CBS 223.65]KDO35469.1 hypothetical protein SPRG_00316 [Saprolegnia parasitica CBS 223.65]|eukprot:XP_012193806.1 hypothetical protein SPRG_00316 [Saprolegnia parasitica CBS 223.65]